MEPLKLEELPNLPSMTRWFNPALLLRLLWQVIVSDLFGQYADRRLIHAALDKGTDADLLNSAREFKSTTGEIWVDYVADLGDGFDATYAIAYLLAQDSLTVAEHVLPRGQMLIMGGDEVYPAATRINYERRTFAPYEAAFPDSESQDSFEDKLDHPAVFAIPGNHDWYDGLNLFLAFFCRRKPKKIGNWRTSQRRSYFALQLTEEWWLWAIDIQLAEDMDQPQSDYFDLIVKHMKPQSKIILCTAVPGWLSEKGKTPSFAVMGFAAWKIERTNSANKSEMKVVAIISGDTHHYSRYSNDESGYQFITAGGGGAFLHGTHSLDDAIQVEWLRSKPKLLLKTDPGEHHQPTSQPACYPNMEQSKRLLWRNLKFPFLNWDFSLVLGFYYWIVAFISIAGAPWMRWVAALILIAAFLGYTLRQEEWRRTLIWCLPQVLLQLLAMIILTKFFVWLNSGLFDMRMNSIWQYAALIPELIIAGGGVGGLIFGVYLSLSCSFGNMNHNDAFSAIRLDQFRNFLRIHIHGEQVEIFPIGVDRVPTRRSWQDNPQHKSKPTASRFVPDTPIQLRLIEGPIIIRTEKVKPLEGAKPMQKWRTSSPQ